MFWIGVTKRLLDDIITTSINHFRNRNHYLGIAPPARYFTCRGPRWLSPRSLHRVTEPNSSHHCSSTHTEDTEGVTVSDGEDERTLSLPPRGSSTSSI